MEPIVPHSIQTSFVERVTLNHAKNKFLIPDQDSVRSLLFLAPFCTRNTIIGSVRAS